jgi:hypothetical protein
MEVSGQIHDPAALIPEETALSIHCLEGWVGPRASLDTVEKSLAPVGKQAPAFEPVARFYSY